MSRSTANSLRNCSVDWVLAPEAPTTTIRSAALPPEPSFRLALEWAVLLLFLLANLENPCCGEGLPYQERTCHPESAPRPCYAPGSCPPSSNCEPRGSMDWITARRMVSAYCRYSTARSSYISATALRPLC